MAIPSYYFANLVREKSVATGAGVFALSGPVPGHRAFAGVVPAATPFCYAIAGVSNPGEWESGVGEIDPLGGLVRSSVTASSNAGALVAFSAGVKTVALTVGATWFRAVGDPPDIESIAGLGPALAAKQPIGNYADTAHAHLVAVAAGAAGFMSGGDKAKLDGVAANATANASDPALRDRSSHTGTQSAATITGRSCAQNSKIFEGITVAKTGRSRSITSRQSIDAIHAGSSARGKRPSITRPSPRLSALVSACSRVNASGKRSSPTVPAR